MRANRSTAKWDNDLSFRMSNSSDVRLLVHRAEMVIEVESFAFIFFFIFLPQIMMFSKDEKKTLDEKALAILAIFRCTSTAAQRIKIYCLKSKNCVFPICKIPVPPETICIGISKNGNYTAHRAVVRSVRSY